MKFEIPSIDLVKGTLTYTTGDGTEVVEELNLTALINVLIAFINKIIANEI